MWLLFQYDSNLKYIHALDCSLQTVDITTKDDEPTDRVYHAGQNPLLGRHTKKHDLTAHSLLGPNTDDVAFTIMKASVVTHVAADGRFGAVTSSGQRRENTCHTWYPNPYWRCRYLPLSAAA
jgi:hypothetical protein